MKALLLEILIFLWNHLKSHTGHDLYNNLLDSALSQQVNKLTRGDNIFSITDSVVSNVDTGTGFGVIIKLSRSI